MNKDDAPLSGRRDTVIDRIAPFRWTAGGLGCTGLRGRALVIAGALLGLLVFFLIPFLVVATISFQIPAITWSVHPQCRA